MRTVEERGIRFIQLWFTDVLGVPKTFAITPAELENALAEGMTFDGSAVDGFSRVQESDVLAKPDPTTFQILPLQSEAGPVAKVVCDILNLDGTPFEGDPRWVLRRTLERAHDKGFSFYAAPEVEWFYLESGDPTNVRPLDQGSYFELTVADLTTDLRKRTVLTLEEMGIPVEYSQHEDSPGQHEVDLRHTDALTMADTVMTTRLIVKEIAQQAGAYATFMPKPFAGVQGSGMHTHFSLFEGDTNAFHDPGDEHGLSKVAKGFIAGLLAHAPEITAVTNQVVNSYKRLVPGTSEAPVYVAWARNNRSVVVNVPRSKHGRGESTRIEYRAPDPACNPYLTYACILSAGLAGVEEGYELPTEVVDNLYQMSPEGLDAIGVRSLPGSLNDAIEEMKSSSLVRETLGEHVFEWFIRNKQAEWADYKTQVTQFELDRYLGRL